MWARYLVRELLVHPRAMAAFPSTPLVILHINDAYELECMRAGTHDAGTCLTCGAPGSQRAAPCRHASPAVGGASRCKSVIAAARAAAAASGAHSLLLHSGDAFSPSIMSAVTRGAHMVPVLRELGVAAACVGNHELDVGVVRAAELMRASGLPWVLSNLTQRSTGLPLCDAAEAVVLEAGPWRVGVIGLVEASWVETLATVKPAAVAWEEPLAAALRLSAALRERQGAHVVLALTHMRLVNDLALREGLAAAERAAPPGAPRPVDAILGGHDHDLAHLLDPAGARVPLLKSGSDFRFVTRLTLAPPGAPPGLLPCAAAPLPGLPAAPVAFLGASPPPPPPPPGGSAAPRAGAAAELLAVAAGVPPDGGMEAVLAALRGEAEGKLSRVVGLTSVALDAREAAVRTGETNIGNMIADLMRRCVKADIAMLNAGTIRANALIPPGLLRARDLVALLPFFGDVVVKVRVPGAVVLAALENSVSQWPAADGRFCQVSGVRFAFDAARAPGARLVPGSVQVLVRRPRGGGGGGGAAARGGGGGGGGGGRAPSPRAVAAAVEAAAEAAVAAAAAAARSSPSAFFVGDGGGCSSGSESDGDGGRLRDTGAVPVDHGPFSPAPASAPAGGAASGAGLAGPYSPAPASAPAGGAASGVGLAGGLGHLSISLPRSSGSLAAPPTPAPTPAAVGAFPPLSPDAAGCESPSVVGLATVVLPRGAAEEGGEGGAAVPPLTLAELACGGHSSGSSGGGGGAPGPRWLGGESASSPRKQWAPLDAAASYTVAIKSYLLSGKDGYWMFEAGGARAPEGLAVEIPEEGGHSLPALLSSHLEVLQGWDGGGEPPREGGGGGGGGGGGAPPSPAAAAGGARADWNSPRGGGDVGLGRSAVAPRTATVARVPSLFFSFVGGEEGRAAEGGGEGGPASSSAAALEQTAGAAALPASQLAPLPFVQYSLAIAPKVEGRIVLAE